MTLSKIVVQPGMSIEDALKKFNTSVKRSGNLSDAKKREFYSKPSVQKREKAKEAKRNKSKKCDF